MLKSIYKKLSIYLRGTTLFLMTILSTVLFADNDLNTIIISGQVINSQHGNPIENHLVYIESSTQTSNRYFKEILTDKEGYYYDTIVTTSNKGYFTISTLDFENNVVDTTLHYRFLSFVAYDLIIANFEIYVPFQTHILHARFKNVQNNNNRLKFEFIDITESEDIISWKWHFGDGDSSIVQNPIHIFEEPGLFKVSLTITTDINNSLASNTISKRIYISERSFYHMGGHAFANYFPVDLGLAYLYLLDSNDYYIPVDTVAFDTLGFYMFYQVPEGDYLVKTQPDSESEFYGEILPTYYGNSMYWKDAMVIRLTNTNWEYDVHMVQGQGIKSGNCLLNGNVIYNILGLPFQDLDAKLVDIYIFDDNDQLLASHYSNEDGFFDYLDIETGTYWLYPEVTGFDSEPLRIILTDDDPSVTGIEIIIGPTAPNFIFDNSIETNIISNIFPNPAKSIINIEFEAQQNSLLKVEVIDLHGRIVFAENGENNYYNNRISFDISHLIDGTYILNLSCDGLQSRKLFVISN